MTKTILITPNFQDRGPVPPHLFVNMESQLSGAISAFGKRESIAVHGPRKAGKTSFLRKFDDIVRRQPFSTLTVRTDLSIYREELTDFLRLLCLELTLTIWRNVFERDFGELSDTLKRPLSVFEGMDKARKSVIAFYRLLKNSRTTLSLRQKSELGATFGLSAQRSEEQSVESEPFPIEVSELLLSLDSLIATALSQYDRILVLADEASMLPSAVGIDTLNSYLELLSDHKFQFVFTGVPTFHKSFLDFSVVCARNLELGRFDSVDHVRELIQLVLDDFAKEEPSGQPQFAGYAFEKVTVTFSVDCAERIFDLGQGIPWRIQSLCDAAVQRAIKTKKTVEVDDVAHAAAKLLPDWQMYDRDWGARPT